MHSVEPLSAVIANNELALRPRRTPGEAKERRAYASLSNTLARSPRAMLQDLTDAAMELCDAHSAGVSLLEEDQDGAPIFRWHALSGRFAQNFWGTMPRTASPCGTVLDRRSWQLMIDPERHYTALRAVRPHISEALLEPFWVGGEACGTIWVLSHDPARRFDDEDRRVLWRLAKFAAVAYERL